MDRLDQLFEAARAARANAHAPYSGFPVGAALLTESGAIFAGCNVENAAYPLGVCAETSAIAAMIVTGETLIADIAVVGGAEPITPCGACRQRLHEFSTDRTRIHAEAATGARQTFGLNELLPHAFGSNDLLIQKQRSVTSR